jgi:hypothetical protein
LLGRLKRSLVLKPAQLVDHITTNLIVGIHSRFGSSIDYRLCCGLDRGRSTRLRVT